MPVIIPPLADPPDLVIPGGYLVAAAQAMPATAILLAGSCVETPALSFEPPMMPPCDLWPIPLPRLGNVLSSNPICTQMGDIIATLGLRPLLDFPLMSTTRWVISGTSRDRFDVPLPGCRVIVLEMGQLRYGASPVAGEVISSTVDGTFSIPVDGNTDYLIIAYLPGSPDVAGITLHPLTPTMI